MPNLKPVTLRLLRRFARARNQTLSVDELEAMLPGDEYEYRLAELLGAGFIEVADYADIPAAADIISAMPVPEAFRMTIAASDYLQALDQEAQERADQRAAAEREKRADKSQAVVDRKQKLRHDYKVAAFTVILTLFVEHIGDILNFVKVTLVPILRSLFH